MNNNWLSFPLSPSNSSLPANDLQATQYHHFPLGLVNENMENPFQNHGIVFLFLTLKPMLCFMSF